MPDESQYFIHPETGDVGTIPEANVEDAIRAGFRPASAEQVRQYDLKKASERDPLGAAKAAAQALGEGVVGGTVGIGTTMMGLVPSAAEILAPTGLVEPETAALAKQKRLEMFGEMARYTTLPGIQQELGLREAEEIKAEREAHPYAQAAGTIASFFVGPAASRVLKAATARAVPVLAAEATMEAGANLTQAVTKAVGLPAKNAAYRAAQAELAAAQATGDAAEIAVKQTALNEATAAAKAAVEEGNKLQVAMLAESGAVPADLAPLVTKEVEVAGKSAREAAKRFTFAESKWLLENVPKGQRVVADTIKKLQNASLTTPAIASKIGTDAAKAIEQSALARIKIAPGLSTKFAEAELAAAKAADDVAVDAAQKAITGARLAKASENLALAETRQELVAKAIGLGLGRSAEMMLFGMQGVANEAALGDPALVAESAYGTLGFDAGLGAGFGVAEALVPPTLRAGLRAARATGNKIKDAIGKVYPEIASMVTGAEPETIRAVLDAKEELESKGLRRIIEEATPMPSRLLEPEVPAGRLKPLKPVDFEKTSNEFSKALQKDYSQIAAPEKGLLHMANKAWRKVQLNKVIEQEVQAAGTDLPMKESLDRAIGFVQDVRARIAPLIPDAITPQQTAQASAYKVNAALAKVEKRLIDFQASNPTAPRVFQEIKWLADDVFDLIKDFGVSATELKAVDRQANSAYSQLRNNIVSLVTDENVWGKAGVLESQWRSDARAFYAARDNLVAVAPKGLIKLLKDPATGRKTEIVVDSSKMKTIVGDINSEKYRTFRDAFKDYLGARNKLVNRISDVSDYVGANVDKSGVMRRLRETESAYDRAIENAVNDASNAAIESENKELIKTLKQEYAAASEARRADINRQINALTASEKAGNLRAGLRIAGKLAAPVAGGLLGGPVGMLGGAAVTAITSPITAAKTLSKLNKAMITVSDKVGGVANVLTGTGAVAVKTGEALGSFATRNKLDEEYKKVERRVRELSADSDALMDQQDAMLAGLADDAPTIADAAKTVNATALQYLANVKPKPPANLPPMQLVTWEPIDAEKRKFVRISEAVIHPLQTLELAGKGALLPEQVDALNTVYPSLMADVRSKLLERIEQTGKVPEKHRMMVSMLLGKDIDGRMQAAKVVPAQSVYGSLAQPPPQKQQQMPVSRAKGLRVAERSAEYDKNARYNAQIGARTGYGP